MYHLVYKGASPHQTIYVFDMSSYAGMNGKFRSLQFSDDVIQGLMDLQNPSRLVFPYSRTVVDLIDHYAPCFQKGFILGHGIGIISSYYSSRNLLTAEIDPLVVEVSKKYFGYTGNNIEIGDGRELFKKQENDSQDIIFLDAYNTGGLPLHLTTQEFFLLTREKLTATGLLVVNYLGKLVGDELFHSLSATISSVYSNVKVYATNPKMIGLQNIFFVASQNLLDNYSPHEASPIQVTGGKIIIDP